MQQSTEYEYDSQGCLWKILDAKQQTTEYGYESQGRLETISYADGRSVTLSYPSTGSGQASGNLAGYDDGVTSAAYIYDALGRKLSETVNYPALSGAEGFSKSFNYSCHPNGQEESGAMHYDAKNDETVYTDLQDAALLYWEADCYLITNETLETLRNEGMPEAVVAPLAYLLDERVCKDEESQAYLRVHIGVEQTATYGDRILAAAHQERSVSR